MKKRNLELLKNSVRINSTFPNEGKLAGFIKDWVKKNVDCKIETQEVDKGRINLIFTKGSDKKTILLSGHLDTVPVVEGWKTDPFKPVVKDGKLYGLGAWDMKAGLYIVLKCLRDFQPKNITLKVALSVDEENYSIGVHKLIDSGFCNDVDFIMVPEPGFVHGEHGIAIGRSGRATFVVEIKGASAHGSFPELGVNAIEQAAIFINLIKGIKLSESEDLGSSILFPRLINSEAKGFSVPDICTVEIDSKLIFPDKPEKILSKLRKEAKRLYQSKKISFMPKIYFKKRPTPFCSPYQIDKNNMFVKACKRAVKETTGKSILFYRNSVADECVFAERLNVPVVTIGPDGGNAHQADEYVEVISLEKVVTTYLTILRNLDTILTPTKYGRS